MFARGYTVECKNVLLLTKLLLTGVAQKRRSEPQKCGWEWEQRQHNRLSTFLERRPTNSFKGNALCLVAIGHCFPLSAMFFDWLYVENAEATLSDYQKKDKKSTPFVQLVIFYQCTGRTFFVILCLGDRERQQNIGGNTNDIQRIQGN